MVDRQCSCDCEHDSFDLQLLQVSTRLTPNSTIIMMLIAVKMFSLVFPIAILFMLLPAPYRHSVPE